MRPLPILLLALLSVPLAAQPVRYVDADASGSGDGLSWANAHTDLQDALAAAQPGDEVWVAEGTYRPTDGADRDATFQLQSGVALYGGFDGTETQRDQRDWATHETVLSGDIGAPGDEADNSHHVVTGSGTDATAVLDGVTVTAARADGLFPRNRGGGMRNDAGSPTVRHVVFRGNVARRSPDGRDAFGAGMYNENGSSPLLEDVRFERNVSGTPGNGAAGGLANRVGSSPTLRGVVFLENEAGALAGGMANESGSHPLLVDVQFIRNHSHGWTGGLDNYDDASPALYNVVFYGNTCANYGGGITNDTGGDALLVNVLFVGNVAENAAAVGAGGLQNDGSSPTLVGVTFVGNEAPNGAADGLGHRGGGTATLRDVAFWGNGTEILDETGGGLDLSHAVVQGGFPGGTAVLDADPLFVRPPSPGPDGTWGTEDDDYGDLRLQPASPALDAGDATHLPADLADLDGDGDTAEAIPLDLDGGPRVQGGALDLGAYEGATVVAAEPPAFPDTFLLSLISPNPFSGSARFSLYVSRPQRVILTLYDTLGRRVLRLHDGPLTPGISHAFDLDAQDLPGGVYFMRAKGENFAATRRAVHLPSPR
ncbi:MAG: choice-of-anchor Q domain-containing protein [Rubricoccaceae bacterium]|nr:choice-of-anchor Q domain-containing protein [Rubricoccaceae bacterium]